MALANRSGVLRRPLLLTILGSLALATVSDRALAGGGWLKSGDQHLLEQRVAIAVGPERTTVWTSLRFDGTAGPVGVVVPVPPNAALDLSSDAWFEALEVATAPRIFPPEGVSPSCPGVEGEPDPFHLAGDVGHTPSLPPAEVVVLDDADAVASWASSSGLTLAPELASVLSGMQGKRFLAARFAAPGGEGLTRTLRVALPGSEPVLPLAVARAQGDELRVTAWIFGDGRAALPGASLATVHGSDLVWDAAFQESNYEHQRTDALDLAGYHSALREAASHQALSHNTALGNGASIDGVVTTYFERAAAYGQASGDPDACVADAASALASASLVSLSCPRADHGVVDGADSCAESPVPGETDPERLRCGDGADDLAVGLSGLSPAGTWLTRYSLRIPAWATGVDDPITFGEGIPVSPVLEAEAVSLASCWDDGSSSSSNSSSSSSSSSSSGSGGPGPSSSSSGGSPGGSGAGGAYTYGDSYSSDTMDCGCSGTAYTSDSYYDDTSSDDCSGDTSDSYYDDSSDDCSGDSSDSYYDDSSEDCISDSDSSYDDSREDCSSDTGSDSSSEDCSIAGAGAGKPRKQRPKTSAITLGLLAVVAPLRRLMRPRRRQGA